MAVVEVETVEAKTPWLRIAIASVTVLLVASALFLKVSLVPGLVVLAAVFIPAERVLAIQPQKIFRRGWHSDAVHFFVNNTLTHFAMISVVAAVYTSLRWLIPNSVFDTISSQPVVLQFVEAVIISETSHYFAHLFTHKNKVMWRFHAVHHSIEEMDWLASGRLHPVDQIFTNAATILPVAVLGFDKGPFAAFLIVTGFQAIIVHANIRVRLGRLSWFVVTPEFHHWHHANQKEAYNRNFSNALPFMDYLMGTAISPKDGARPRRFGVSEKVPEEYIKQFVWPFKRRKRPTARRVSSAAVG